MDAHALGLVCDSKTDNAAVFELIRLKTMQMKGQTVVFAAEASPCLSSKPLEAVSDTTYKANPGTVMLRPTLDNSANPALFRASGVSDVLVQGLGFEGKLAAAAAPDSLVVVFKSSRIVFDEVNVRNTGGIAIVFSTDVSGSGVQHSSFTNVGSRWKYTGSKSDQYQGVAFCCGTANSNNFVTGSRFDDVGLDAISFSRQTDFLVDNNRFSNSGGAVDGIVGARLAAGATNKGLVGGAAIYGAVSRRVKVTNNVSEGAGGNGIDLFMVNNAQITANTARRSGGNGIGFAAASGAQIIHNVLVDNNQAQGSIVSAPQAGIFLTGGRHGQPAVRQVTISENIVTDDQPQKTQNYGVQLQDGSTALNINVDQTNRLAGNARGELGEGLAQQKVGSFGPR